MSIFQSVLEASIARPSWQVDYIEKLLTMCQTGTDVKGQGIVDGAQAVGFFSKSGLDTQQLREIWALSSYNKQRFLDKNEFTIFCLHIQKVQSGIPLNQGKPIYECTKSDLESWQLPKFQGIELPEPPKKKEASLNPFDEIIQQQQDLNPFQSTYPDQQPTTQVNQQSTTKQMLASLVGDLKPQPQLQQFSQPHPQPEQKPIDQQLVQQQVPIQAPQQQPQQQQLLTQDAFEDQGFGNFQGQEDDDPFEGQFGDFSQPVQTTPQVPKQPTSNQFQEDDWSAFEGADQNPTTNAAEEDEWADFEQAEPLPPKANDPQTTAPSITIPPDVPTLDELDFGTGLPANSNNNNNDDNNGDQQPDFPSLSRITSTGLNSTAGQIQPPQTPTVNNIQDLLNMLQPQMPQTPQTIPNLDSGLLLSASEDISKNMMDKTQAGTTDIAGNGEPTATLNVTEQIALADVVFKDPGHQDDSTWQTTNNFNEKPEDKKPEQEDDDAWAGAWQDQPNSIKPEDEEDDDDGFGDFNQPEEPIAQQVSSVVKQETKEFEQKPTTTEDINDDDEEFGDFGDFEEAPVASAVAVVATSQDIDTSGQKSHSISQNNNKADLDLAGEQATFEEFDAPESNGQTSQNNGQNLNILLNTTSNSNSSGNDQKQQNHNTLTHNLSNAERGFEEMPSVEMSKVEPICEQSSFGEFEEQTPQDSFLKDENLFQNSHQQESNAPESPFQQNNQNIPFDDMNLLQQFQSQQAKKKPEEANHKEEEPAPSSLITGSLPLKLKLQKRIDEEYPAVDTKGFDPTRFQLNAEEVASLETLLDYFKAVGAPKFIDPINKQLIKLKEVASLQKEMKQAAMDENFEQALELKLQIKAVQNQLSADASQICSLYESFDPVKDLPPTLRDHLLSLLNLDEKLTESILNSKEIQSLQDLALMLARVKSLNNQGFFLAKKQLEEMTHAMLAQLKPSQTGVQVVKENFVLVKTAAKVVNFKEGLRVLCLLGECILECVSLMEQCGECFYEMDLQAIRQQVEHLINTQDGELYMCYKELSELFGEDLKPTKIQISIDTAQTDSEFENICQLTHLPIDLIRIENQQNGESALPDSMAPVRHNGRVYMAMAINLHMQAQASQ